MNSIIGAEATGDSNSTTPLLLFMNDNNDDDDVVPFVSDSIGIDDESTSANRDRRIVDVTDQPTSTIIATDVQSVRNNSENYFSTQNILRTLFPWMTSTSINGRDSATTTTDHHNATPSTGTTTPTEAAAATTNDSMSSILFGITTLILLGSMIGIISYYCSSSSSGSDNTNENSSTNIISKCLGYIYFIMWSISFYPQVIYNIQYCTTNGVSIDFIWFNWIGFICYTTYNVSLYYNPIVQRQYEQRHHPGDSITPNDDNEISSSTTAVTIPIQSNDVAFAIHALFFCTVLLVQVLYYDGIQRLLPSRTCAYILLLLLCCIILYPVVFFVITPILFRSSLHHPYQILDYIYFLSYIKISITCMKYIPQVYYNHKRRSTVGWNIWQILLDLFGGIFSIVQLLYDDHVKSKSHNNSDGTTIGSSSGGGISNVPKFMLGNISIIFDVIFIVQHYILYRNSYETAHTTIRYHAMNTTIGQENDYDHHHTTHTDQTIMIAIEDEKENDDDVIVA